MFKFIPDTRIPDYSGSALFTAGGISVTVRCKFRHLRQTDFAAWARRECNSLSSAAEMAAHVAEVLTSWDDMTDASDNPLPCTVQSMTDLFEFYPGAYGAFVAGYSRARYAAIEKN